MGFMYMKYGTTINIVIDCIILALFVYLIFLIKRHSKKMEKMEKEYYKARKLMDRINSN